MKRQKTPGPIQRVGSPSLDDMICSLNTIGKQPAHLLSETQQVVAIARRFNEEVVRPINLNLDVKLHEDPDYLAWEIVQKANQWGFYTMWIPKIFGGQGFNFPSLSNFVEEIASECLGIANIIGVHYLGVASLVACWNTRIANKILKEVKAGEKNNRPCILSLALTEPGAGTDLEEVDLMDRANLACHAQKVKNGYIVNGNKIFISNGHLSTWHILITFSNLKKPSETMVFIAVKNGTKGFSFGRIERKMGQKACPASELIFKDCFIPNDLVCLDEGQNRQLTRSVRDTNMQVIDYIVSTSRAAVGAFGVGVGRGAFEAACEFAQTHEYEGKLLVQYEWVQAMLAEMYKNVSIGRLTYMETNYANGLYGYFRYLQRKPVYYLMKYTPQIFIDSLISPLLNHRAGTWLLKKLHLENQTDEEIKRTSGWASMAKFAGTDVGMKNCEMALELMGRHGLLQKNRVEKMMRDAKLLQIYEGTNQLNRLNLFKCLIAGPNVKLFKD